MARARRLLIIITTDLKEWAHENSEFLDQAVEKNLVQKLYLEQHQSQGNCSASTKELNIIEDQESEDENYFMYPDSYDTNDCDVESIPELENEQERHSGGAQESRLS